MLFAGAIQMLSPGSYALILAANGILYLVACAAFHKLCKLAFPDSSHDLGRALLESAFVLHPAVLASVVQPTIDLPLLPAFLWGAVFLLRGRHVALIVVGIVMAFCKESGVLLYGALVASLAIVTMLRAERTVSAATRSLVPLAPLAIPFVVFAAYLGYRALLPHEHIVWVAGTSEKSIIKRFVLPRFDRPLLSFLALIFVLNFAWITTIIVGVDAFVGARRWLARSKARAVEGANTDAVRFLTILTILTVYLLTRFTTYANTRYVLATFALLPLAMYASITRLRRGSVWRNAAAGLLAIAFAASTVRTVDPVSRNVYGTFAFGDHRLLRLTRITHECCGAGRDQLVYNLQFTNLADLTSDVMAAARPDSSAQVFVPHDMLWGALGPLDATTRRRTLTGVSTVQPRLLESDSLSSVTPAPAAVFVALPNGDVKSALDALSFHYVVGPERQFARGAYRLSSYRLTLRNGS
jgi:hypothetical protein